jgi:hypothetical protein
VVDDEGARPLDLRAYLLDGNALMPIVPGTHAREWMTGTSTRFAQRCLPLLIANRSGWTLLNTRAVEVVWNGGDRITDLEVSYLDARPAADRIVMSHFGTGIVSWQIPYLFRTPPGYDLWVRGPANMPKDGISPLEGIVETDWTAATFTMSWKVTRPSWPIRFEENEPVAMLVPVRRHELERFTTSCARLSEESDLDAAHERWASHRKQFRLDRLDGLPPSEWQEDYFVGQPLAGTAPADHRTRRQLGRFDWERLREAPFGWDLDDPL